MEPTLSPEFRLVAACASWPPSDRRIKAIHGAAAGALDWPRLVRIARRQGVTGLVHDGLTRACPGVPTDIALEIASESQKILCENLRTAVEALRLQRLFCHADVSVLFVKGAPLAVLAFGNLGLRGAMDIDLLVSRETLPAAITVLAGAGYRRFDPPAEMDDAHLHRLMPLRKDFGFINPDTGLRVELHWRLFLNPYAMPEGSLMSASRVVPLAGANGLRTLGAEDLFAYLCMHGALHWWNQLKWLADINALLAGLTGLEVQRLVRAAQARGAGRAAAQALRLCYRLLGTPLPAQAMAELARSATVRWLETTALNAMTSGQGEGHPHKTRFGTTRGSLSTFLLNPSWRYWVAELKNQWVNPADVLAVPLPQRLRFLYPVLRVPLWMWRHALKPAARQRAQAASAEGSGSH